MVTWESLHKISVVWGSESIQISKHIQVPGGLLLLFSCSIVSDSLQPQLCLVIAAHQASLSFTVSQSLLKLLSMELVMPSNHLILCHPLLLLPSIFPASVSLPMSQLFASGDQSIGASISLLAVNTQDILCKCGQLFLLYWILFDSSDYKPPGSSVHGDSLGKNTGVGCQSLPQEIFPTQG